MPICKKCLTTFPNRYFNSMTKKIHNLSNRKFCLSCSPFGKHNTKDITKDNILNQNTDKYCPQCKEIKPVKNFYNRRNGKGNSAYCKLCTTKQTLKRQHKIKQQSIEYKGGKCVCCGYNKYNGALEFHHLDPAQKDFQFSVKLVSFEKIKSELDKCVLVCSNCHREIHAGFIQLDKFIK